MNNGAFTRSICGILGVLFLVASVQNAALAAMVSNQQLSQEMTLQQQREEVKAFVAREEVQEQLVAFGVAPGDAVKRVDTMTTEEILALHGKIGELPAGEGILETVVLVLLVLILLDVAGVTDVFSGV